MGNAASVRTMQLFGVPYQFLESVDPIVPQISGSVGAHFTKNILYDAPFISIIPGEPRYIAKKGTDAATSVSNAIGGVVQGAATAITNAASFTARSKMGNGTGSGATSDQIRYYDFRENYAEYIRYVNNLCRACAMLLEIGDENLVRSDGTPDKKLKSFGWENYHWNGADRVNFKGKTSKTTGATYEESIKLYQSMADSLPASMPESDKANIVKQWQARMKEEYNLSDEEAAAMITMDANGHYVISSNNFISKFAGNGALTFDYEGVKKQGLVEELSSAFINYTETSLVQFYIDSDTDISETFTNTSGDSWIKSSLVDSGSAMFKEIAFIAGTAGVGEEATNIQSSISKLINSAEESLNEHLGSSNNGVIGNLATVTGRIVDMLTSCANGETIIMPKIYQQSDIARSFSCTVHLKSIYGTKKSYYMDILVPLMHLLALCLPRQATANSYRAPFLVKAYIDGAYTCNLGLVSQMSIKRSVNDSSFTVDGFPTEIDVTFEIEDLYSDLSICATEEPALFIENASLIDYLATSCGLSLYTPDITAKLSLFSNTIKNAVTDIPDTIVGQAVGEVANLLNVWGTTLGS